MNSGHILLLGMGGTIAGVAMDRAKPMAYQAGAIPVSGLVQDLELDEDFGEIEAVQVANVDSRHMTEELLIQLGWAVKDGLERPDILGIVVTHGTTGTIPTTTFQNLERLGMDFPAVATLLNKLHLLTVKHLGHIVYERRRRETSIEPG
mgnify:CR=1 FL=1